MGRKFTIKFDDGTEIKGVEHDKFAKSPQDLQVLRFTEDDERARMRNLIEEAISRTRQDRLADKHVATEILATIRNNKEFVDALTELIYSNYNHGRNGVLATSSSKQATDFLRKYGIGSV